MKKSRTKSHIILAKQILTLLPVKTFRKLIFLTGFQITTTALDILALLLLGKLSQSGFDYAQGNKTEMKFPRYTAEYFTQIGIESQFAVLFGIVISLFILKTVIAIWGNRRILNFLGAQSANASFEVLKRLLACKPQYVTSKKTQELLYGVTSGIDSLVLQYLGSLVLVFSELFFLSFLIITLLIIQPVAGLCSVFIFGGLGFLIHKSTSKSVEYDSAKSTELSVTYSQQLLETFHLFREHYLRSSNISAASNVQMLRRKFLEIRANLMFLPIKSKYLFEFVLILGGATVAVVQLLIADVKGAISSVVIFLAASSRILPSVVRMQGAALSLKQSEGTSQLTLRQIQEFEENQNVNHLNKDDKSKVKSNSNYILVENLNFTYPAQERPTLSKINFSIKRGQFVAIVGESGAGKSTLADILLGIQEPSSGSVFINGFSARVYVGLKPGVLAYVPQDIAILDGTISENVSLSPFGTANITQVENSLKHASLWHEVQRLPQGIQSIVGERGMRLSGGQRQRLGIARALYTNPELIVFDEATSSLDSKTEKVLTDSIYKSQGEVTLIVIAHRLSTVKKADLVLFLEQGELVAKGNFDEVRSKVSKFDEQARLANL